MASTEQVLRDWEYGPLQAERLVAQILHLEGNSEIDPQHPLGGPDGKKDILFKRKNERWIAAVFFPSTPTTFTEIRRKFVTDSKGVERNKAAGIAFFVNQRLTIAERTQLMKYVSPRGADIYHCERLRAILDSPRGCGLRLQYLRISMTEEEQWAFWQSMNTDVAQNIASSRNQLDRIERKLDEVFIRSNNLLYNATTKSSSLLKALPSITFATASLNLQLLCWIHRMATEDLSIPEETRGRLRAVSVWLGKPGSPYGSANLHPPEPEELPKLLDKLFQWWTRKYQKLLGTPRHRVVSALADLHHRLLVIHPFLDANGRVSRLLIDQAAHELLGVSVSKELTSDRVSYYKALHAADNGDMGPLKERISAALI
jgi:fido (protein-threonine AMPylation protein)